MERLADPDGVLGGGLVPPIGYRARYRDGAASGFGRDVSLRCPFWVGGSRACGVWADRNAVCRTWYCLHDHGAAGHHLQMTARDALRAMEGAIGRALAAERPPPPDDAPAAAKRGWYRWAGARSETLTAEDVAPRFDAPTWRERLRAAFDAVALPIPDRVTARVAAVLPIDGGVRLVGYSGWDPVDVPHTIFAFLARLDGATSWQDAGGDVETVARLWRAGVLEPSDGAAFSPGVTVTVRRGEGVDTWHVPPGEIPW